MNIPEKIKQNCNFDSRGYPIPYIVLVDNSGVSHFKVNDSIKIIDCIVNNKCSICGTILNTDKWLIGGPMSAFHPNGAYNDTPVHKECGEFALKTCPYLAYSKYNTNIDLNKIRNKIDADNLFLYNKTTDPDRVPLFVFGKISDYKVSKNGYIIREKPFLEIEYYNDGKKLENDKSLEIIKSYFKSKKQIYNIN